MVRPLVVKVTCGAEEGERVDFNGRPEAIEILETGPIP